MYFKMDLRLFQILIYFMINMIIIYNKISIEIFYDNKIIITVHIKIVIFISILNEDTNGILYLPIIYKLFTLYFSYFEDRNSGIFL